MYISVRRLHAVSGVLQGSNISPLLFLLILDLSQINQIKTKLKKNRLSNIPLKVNITVTNFKNDIHILYYSRFSLNLG